MPADRSAGGAHEPPLDGFEAGPVGPLVGAHGPGVVAVRAVGAIDQ